MPPQALQLIQAPIQGVRYRQGLAYKKADLHLHSHYSYDVLNLPDLSPRALYEKAIRKGMGFFALTDHDTMKGILALERELAAEYGTELPIPIIRGSEIKVKDQAVGHTIHVNVLGLDEAQFLDLARRRKSLDAFLDYCVEHRLYHAYNHPFWFEHGERPTLETVSSLIARFPVIELNAGRIPQLNHRTATLAAHFGKHLVATSDSHTGQVAKAYTMAPGSSAEEFLANLQNGTSVAVPCNATFADFMDEVKHVIDLVFAGQEAFRMKRTFLRTNPWARAIAAAALRSERVMKPGRLQRSLCRSLQVLAHGPAWAFIRQQERMDLRLGDDTLGELSLGELSSSEALAH